MDLAVTGDAIYLPEGNVELQKGLMSLPRPCSRFTLLQKRMVRNWCSKHSLSTPSLPRGLAHLKGPHARAQSSSGPKNLRLPTCSTALQSQRSKDCFPLFLIACPHIVIYMCAYIKRVTNIASRAAHADEGQKWSSAWRRNPTGPGEMQWLEAKNKFTDSGSSQIMLPDPHSHSQSHPYLNLSLGLTCEKPLFLQNEPLKDPDELEGNYPNLDPMVGN